MDGNARSVTFLIVEFSDKISRVHTKMATDPAIATVLQFEQLINTRNPESICSLLTEDSVFVDSLGNRVEGPAQLRGAWEGYFKMVPDYTISHEEILANENVVAMFGMAEGTFSRGGQKKPENVWKTPAAWKAIVKNGKIALWQVFADNEPIRAIMRRESTPR
jgi:ketosteroid isomerase-like protein